MVLMMARLWASVLDWARAEAVVLDTQELGSLPWRESEAGRELRDIRTDNRRRITSWNSLAWLLLCSSWPCSPDVTPSSCTRRASRESRAALSLTSYFSSSVAVSLHMKQWHG